MHLDVHQSIAANQIFIVYIAFYMLLIDAPKSSDKMVD